MKLNTLLLWRHNSVSLGLAALSSLALVACNVGSKVDVEKYAADLVASLTKACPMASPSDAVAHDACRKSIGTGADAAMREYSLLWGGDQPEVPVKDKKTTVFRGDLFQDLYLSLYMFTGKYAVSEAPDGTKMVAAQAYFRNGLPPGHYPYPFWHSAQKWDAYEKSNEIRFYVAPAGKIKFAARSHAGSEENRGPYAHVSPPAFTGQWMWKDNEGALQPVVTLFSDSYSQDNPNLIGLDVAYRKLADNLRSANCNGCHSPDGHKKMNRLTLIQTPLHAASNIEEILRDVQDNKMPLDDHNDPKPLEPNLKGDLLANGKDFQQLLRAADDWERANGRAKPSPRGLR